MPQLMEVETFDENAKLHNEERSPEASVTCREGLVEVRIRFFLVFWWVTKREEWQYPIYHPWDVRYIYLYMNG